jgi:cytochrome P450
MGEVQELELAEFGEAFFQNPAGVYQQLREHGPALPPMPVVLPNGWRGWLVTSYEDARRLLADPRLRKNVNEMVRLFPPGSAAAYGSMLSRHMLNSDPPDHTRLRKLVGKAFTGRAVEQLRPRIEQIASELLAAMAVTAVGTPGSSGPGQVVDLIESYALPLPIMVISELLGMPPGDWGDFRGWTLAYVTGQSQEDVAAASAHLTGYLTALIADKKARPGDDLLSRLIQVSDEGSQLTPAEVLNMALLLLVAGFETTVNLIGNGALALLSHPGQLALLRSQPSLMPAAIEELLRYDGPLHTATVRFTSEPVQVGDTEIPEGQLVFISLLAANRDDSRFAHPGQLDILRESGGNLAFGHGIHHCVGAPLARLEGQIAIRQLLNRFPGIALADADAPRYRKSLLMHGLQALPVTTGQPAA